MQKDEHTHLKATNAEHYAISRRRKREGVLEEIDEQLAGASKRTCNDVSRNITRMHPEVTLYAKDVQNISDKNDRESLNG